MVYAANYWLNMFPSQGGISQTLSPRTLLTGQTWSYTTHCKLVFGDYIQTHEKHDNSMATRTIGAIALHPTGNTQGGYFFFSLSTGRVLNRGRWTSLPMPNEVIDRVHCMARQEHGNSGLLFEDRDHNPLVDPHDDGDNDSTYQPEEDEDDDDDDDDDDGDDDGDENPPAHPNEATHNNPPDGHDEHGDGTSVNEEGVPGADMNNNAQAAEPENIQGEENDVPGENDEDDGGDESIGNDHSDATIDNHGGRRVVIDDPTLPPRARRELKRLANDGIGPTIYKGRMRSQTQHAGQSMATNGNLEVSTPLPYQHMTDFEKELFHRQIAGVRVPSEIGYEQNEALRHTMLTQYTLKKGLQVFGAPGVEAVYKELLQLHERKVGEPRDATKLSPTQKKNALGYLMFLKQKRSGQIKGQGCADGRKQRLYTPKG